MFRTAIRALPSAPCFPRRIPPLDQIKSPNLSSTYLRLIRTPSPSPSPPRKEAPATVPLAAVEMHAKNPAPQARYIQKADAAQELGLQVRDLRAVDPSFRSHSPAILPRESGIIIHLAYVRVIIVADRVIVFDPVNPAVEAFLPRLQSKLDSPGHPMPFEFRAVEAVLVEVCRSFNGTIGTLIPSLDLVLDTLSTTTDFGGGTVQNCMDRLLPLENALNEFAVKVSQTRAAVNEVLASDVGLNVRLGHLEGRKGVCGD
eukprot:GFKZ01015488.1.p1 GENE.GFKZ01015488.1~~GFKZ01015488.1.p1  ORF type:complete len:258 (-),score=31.80 GFKZ01015488.1:1430-2203(-)